MLGRVPSRLPTATVRRRRSSCRVSGPAGQRDLIATVAASGRATETDLTIAGHLATVLTGGSGSPGSLVPETAIMALEREALLALVRLPATRARIDHMLKTGKPLNN